MDVIPPTCQGIIPTRLPFSQEAYSAMKNETSQELKKMLSETTDKGKEELGQAVTLAKTNAIADINKEYEAILKDLVEYDTTKEDLEKTTRAAIEDLNKAQTSCNTTIKEIAASNSELNDKLALSKTTLDTTTVHTDELIKTIDTARTSVENMETNTNDILKSIKNATTARTEKIIGDSTSYLTSLCDVRYEVESPMIFSVLAVVAFLIDFNISFVFVSMFSTFVRAVSIVLMSSSV